MNAFLPIAGSYLSQLPNRHRQVTGMDGGFCIAGCDKNKPGAIIGMLFANVPANDIDAGTTGRESGTAKTRTLPPFQSVGEVSARRMSREDSPRVRSSHARALASVGGTTRRTLWRALSPLLGLSLIDSLPNGAGEDQEKAGLVSKSRTCLLAIEMDSSSCATSSRENYLNEGGRNSHGDSGIDQRSTSHSE